MYLTGSRVSGVTPSLSNHAAYALPTVFSGNCLSFSRDRLLDVILGLSRKILRPVGFEIIACLSLVTKYGFAVASPSDAMRSWRYGSISDPKAEPTANAPRSIKLRGT